MTDAQDRQAVEGFYRKLLSSKGTLTEDQLYEVLGAGYVGVPDPPAGPGAQGFFDTMKLFGQLIPDLSWEPQEIIRHGNRYTVRGKATGTPVGPFLGVEPTGKSFDIMSIDILTVEEGRVVHSFHVEDWATAIAQLTA